MNKIAILPLKEMPSSCSECSFSMKTDDVNTIRCRTQQMIKKYGYEPARPLDKIAIDCPLISIDIDELEKTVKHLSYYGSEKIDMAIMNMADANTIKKGLDTIKSTIDKLKGVE